MRVSVIISTYNGAHKIVNLLNCLVQQTYAADEIIVVVDGSTDDTCAVIKNYCSLFRSFKVIVQENGGRSKVRNRGAQEAVGDLLVFFDDDMQPAPDCLATHATHHAAKNPSILTGAHLDISGQGFSDFQNYRAWLSSQWIAPIIRQGDKALNNKCIFISSANFSIPKCLFLRLGGFNEQLTDGEDFDLAFRASRQHIPLYYNHAAFAWHMDLITFEKYINRVRQYYNAGNVLSRIAPDLYSDYFEGRRQRLQGHKKLFFRLFCHLFWIRSADKGSWMFLPRAARYRLYNWIVTANCAYFPNIVAIGS